MAIERLVEPTAAKADAEGAQKIIAHRAGGPQQDGLKKQPPLGHISQKGG